MKQEYSGRPLLINGMLSPAMHDYWFLIALAVWVVLQRWILPRFGVKT
jgi:hypothetical protein